MRTWLNSLVVCFSIILSSQVNAVGVCSSALNRAPIQTITEAPPFEQWLIWEQESNFSMFRKSRLPINAPVIQVRTEDVKMTFLKSASKALKKMLVKFSMVAWFKHPYNTAAELPYFGIPSDTSIVVYETASRSLAFKLGDEFYTLKTPTDHPHGPNGEYQPSKATTKEDILDGINRMEYIERVDKLIGVDRDLLLAKEVAMVADKTTGEGYLIRDLSFLKSGNYYLPALSIPYVGREIAEQNGQSAEEFWKSAYAKVLGRAKAKLLLRYGAQMETPNSQNMLIEFDMDMRPTGKIVFRDISDTVLIEGVAEGLGESTVLTKDKELGVENTRTIVPYWSNSSWRFDEAGDKSFSYHTLVNWGLAHDQAYRNEIERSLSVNLSSFRSIENSIEFNEYMQSNFIKQKLQRYRAELIEQEKRRLALEKAS